MRVYRYDQGVTCVLYQAATGEEKPDDAGGKLRTLTF